MGKSNCVYGVYRVNVFREAWNQFPFTDWSWGLDNCFVLSALARSGICIDERVLFKKRIIRDTDIPEQPDMIDVDNWRNYWRGGTNSLSYIKNTLKAVKGTPYYWMTMTRILRGLI